MRYICAYVHNYCMHHLGNFVYLRIYIVGNITWLRLDKEVTSQQHSFSVWLGALRSSCWYTPVIPLKNLMSIHLHA